MQTHLSGPERLNRRPELLDRKSFESDELFGLSERPNGRSSQLIRSKNEGIHEGASAEQQQRKRDFAGAWPAEERVGGATYGAARHSLRAGRPRDKPSLPRADQLQRSDSSRTLASTSTDYTSQMYLDNTMPLEVQSHVGGTAYLVCRLRSIQQQLRLQVSWVRNMQILTSGELRYTSDERFRPTHLAGTHDWVLEIHNVNANDEGPYECQVNSEPKAASVTLQLHVIAITVEIAEGSEVQVGEDEQIKLTCRVEFAAEDTSEPEESGQRAPRRPGGGRFGSQHYIYWYKDNVSLEYNNPRGGIKVELRENASNLEKGLTIEDAQSSDSGEYVCKLLPELNEVPPAQARLTVGGSSSSVSSGSIRMGSGFPFARVDSAESQLLTSGLSVLVVAILVVVVL